MKNQANPQQKTHCKTTKHNNNQQEKQTNNKQLLSPKTGILDQTRRRPHRRDIA